MIPPEAQKELSNLLDSANKVVKSIKDQNESDLQTLNGLMIKMSPEEKVKFNALIKKLAPKMQSDQVEALNDLIKAWV